MEKLIVEYELNCIANIVKRIKQEITRNLFNSEKEVVYAPSRYKSRKNKLR